MSDEVVFNDSVDHPHHYTKHFPWETIQLIKQMLTPDEFRGYCLGNELKYRLRAGFKGDAAEDVAKSLKYNEFRNGA